MSNNLSEPVAAISPPPNAAAPRAQAGPLVFIPALIAAEIPLLVIELGLDSILPPAVLLPPTAFFNVGLSLISFSLADLILFNYFLASGVNPPGLGLNLLSGFPPFV